MVLAEALLRVPDAATADRLIEDKLATGDWSCRGREVERASWSRPRPGRSASPPASSSRARRPRRILESLIKRLGLPAVRTATRQAMRLLGSHFVLGQTIEEALDRAADHQTQRYSFDMLGEGARTAADADRYFARLCGRHRRHRGDGRRGGAAQPAGHFGQAVRAASALRGDLARARAQGARARGSSSSPARRATMTSTSPSMPRRPTGSN